MRMTTVASGLVVTMALLAGGCGQGVKKENEQLRAQVAALQKENLTLKGEATSLRADAEAMKKQAEALAKERQALEEKVKEIEAKIAAQPGKKPPLKPKKMSIS